MTAVDAVNFELILAGKRPVLERMDGALWGEFPGEVRLQDGAVFPAVLLLCVSDSGEHYGTAVRLPDGTWTDQMDPDFCARLGRTKEEVFPYRYRYTPLPDMEDFHLGPDGWSR